MPTFFNERLAAEYEGGSYVRIGCGHPVHQQEPEGFFLAMFGFLTEQLDDWRGESRRSSATEAISSE